MPEKTISNAGVSEVKVVDAYKAVEKVIDESVSELNATQTGAYTKKELQDAMRVFSDFNVKIQDVLTPEIEAVLAKSMRNIDGKLEKLFQDTADELGIDVNELTVNEADAALASSQNFTDEEKYMAKVLSKQRMFIAMANYYNHIIGIENAVDELRSELKNRSANATPG
jgi:hypothetical protein